MLRKALSKAKEYQLTREDRLGLASMLVCRDVESWKTLTEAELVRVLDAFDGFFYIATLIAQRPHP